MFKNFLHLLKTEMSKEHKYKNKCCIPGCHDRTSQRHGFPRDEYMCKIWKENIQSPELDDLVPEQLYKKYVCHKHFAKDNHEPGAKRGLLKFAVPTLFPWSDEKPEVMWKSPYSAPFTKGTAVSISSVVNGEETLKSSINSGGLPLKTEGTPNSMDSSMSLESVKPFQLPDCSSEIEYTDEAKLLLSKCRLCFLNPGMFKISAVEGLLEKISNYVKITLVETPNHPQSICLSCKTLLENIHHFATKVHAANRKLQRILSESLALQNKNFTQPVEDSQNIPQIDEVQRDTMQQIDEVKQEGLDSDILAGRFKCEFCGERFFYVTQYRLHKKTHPVLYVCDDVGCGRKFSTERSFKRHLYNHTRRRELRKLAMKQKTYTCRVCKKPFVNVRLLKEHKATHLNFPCPAEDCKTILKNWQAFYNHMWVHNDNEKCLCQVCGKTFPTQKKLYQHEKIHKGIRYKCDICNVSYAFKTTLALHMQVKHEGVRYYCSMCPNSYASRVTLYYHERLHFGKKNFQCNLCPKSFSYKNNLKIHIQRHQGIKRYQCNVCLKSFVTKNSLQTHEKIHIGEKFVCEVEGCEKVFTRIDRIRNHIKLVHPEELDK